jgi:hypothetical protein
MNKIRQDYELPAAIKEWGWQFHHMGIPSAIERPGEKYIPHLKMYVSGFETSPFGVEWMRFEADSPVHELVQTLPHIAFVVDDLEDAIKNRELLSGPDSPSCGVRVAMIEHNGAPVELMAFER